MNDNREKFLAEWGHTNQMKQIWSWFEFKFKEAHPTIKDWCCACDYDQTVMERKIREAKQFLVKELREKIEGMRVEFGEGEFNPDPDFNLGWNNALYFVLELLPPAPISKKGDLK